jgi:SAM-dependent methyltransferase
MKKRYIEIISSVLPPLAEDTALIRQSTVVDELPNLDSFSRVLRSAKLLRKHLRFLDYHLALAGGGIRGKSVLDAGSGLGLSAIIYSVLSGSPACGVEKSEHLVSLSQQICRKLAPEYRPLIRHADVIDMPFEDDIFDVITCFEALSHFRYPEKALEAMARKCKRGGFLVISDGNNSLNESIRTRTREYWRHFEKGPSGTYTRDRCHFVNVCYEDVRREIAREYYPQIRACDRDRIAAGTFGYNKAEVLSVCRTFRQEHHFPEHFFDGAHVPVDPIKDDVRENLLDPVGLKHALEGMGFRVSLYPYFGAARNALLGAANIAVRSLVPFHVTLRSSKLFIIAARKVEAYP